MKKLILWLLLSLIASPAFAVLAIDGSVTNTGATSSVTASLTTTKSNDVIIVFVSAGTSATVSTVADASGLTWTRRQTLSWASGASHFDEWYAIATNPLTTDVITVTFSGTSASRVTAFGVSSANTTTPFDVNGSLPAAVQFVDSTQNISATISTTNANTMLIGFVGAAGGIATLTRPSGFTQIISAGTNSDASKSVVSVAQSSVAEQWSWTAATTARGLLVDAIQEAPPATGGVHSHGFPG